MKVRRVVATCLLGAVGVAGLPTGASAQPASPAPATTVAPTISTVVLPPTRAAAHVPGAQGSHIVALQKKLIARGHRIPAGATGYFGGQTKAAVAAFQRSQGWRGAGADGIPGPQTLARLGVSGSASPAPTVRKVAASSAPSLSGGRYAVGVKGSHIVALQRALIARGHRIPAGATGYFGGQTKAAVASFQRSQGWRGAGADGIPGRQTLARLGGSAPSLRTVAAPTSALSPRTFIARYGQVARSAQAASGVPALVTLGQAALESGWGRGAAGNNFFGVKARPGETARQLRTTYEVLPTPNAGGFPQIISVTKRADGRYTYKIRDWFRTYPTAQQAFLQHNNLLRSSRYSGAFRYTGDPYRFAAAIAAAGYATDPAYTRKLHDVMRLIQRNGFR